MTTIVLDPTLANQPAVHAFVIGIGDYPFLKGGSQQRAKHWELGQLSSAPHSALEIASWLASTLSLPATGPQPARRLGSLELLVSQAGPEPAQFRDPANPAAAPVDIERAGIANIKAAFARWYQRAGAVEDNLALFLFSGHGVEKGKWHGLLADSFDASKPDPFEDMIDFDEFALGMDQCLARQQCFFIDACRNTPPELLARVGANRGTPLVAPAYDSPSDVVRDAAIIRATAAHQTAYGLVGETTRFTSALLRVLRGAGVTELGGRWEVRTDNMVFHLNALLNYDSRVRALPAQLVNGPGSDSMGFALHVPDHPLVPIVIGCEPETDTPLADLSLSRDHQPMTSRPAAATAWELEVALDEYELVATFANGRPERRKRFVAQPPIREVRL